MPLLVATLASACLSACPADTPSPPVTGNTTGDTTVGTDSSADAAVGHTDASAGDVGADALVGDACQGDVGCGGVCEKGNSYGIGHYCSPAGAQCNDTKYAFFCTVDFEETDLWFCTRPCADDSDCAENATCRADDGGGIKGCFPDICEGF
jgi:hypothetical protein